MSTQLNDIIEKEITVRGPKERVFQAITDAKQIIKWFPDAVEGEIAVGSRPVFDFGKYGKTELVVIAVDPFDYFAYRWIPDSSPGDALTDPSTLVEFRLTEVPDGILVKVKESGFSTLHPEAAEKKYTDNNEGWVIMLECLQKYLA